MDWKKSSYSGAGNDCVELASDGAVLTGIGDSKPGGARMMLSDSAIRSLVVFAKAAVLSAAVGLVVAACGDSQLGAVPVDLSASCIQGQSWQGC